jgi:GR25 family glycosyltransferase involved in LPS biosynthesis
MRMALGVLFRNHESGIILEDDVQAHPTFFAFSDLMLSRHKDSSVAWTVNGWSPIADTGQCHPFWVRHSTSWGWATWRDRFSAVDWDISELSQQSFMSTRGAQIRPSAPFLARHWARRIEEHRSGRASSWTLAWIHSMWKQGGMAISPPVRLATPGGLGEYSTNTQTLPKQWLRQPKVGWADLDPVAPTIWEPRLFATHERQAFDVGWSRLATSAMRRSRRALRRLALQDR